MWVFRLPHSVACRMPHNSGISLLYNSPAAFRVCVPYICIFDEFSYEFMMRGNHESHSRNSCVLRPLQQVMLKGLLFSETEELMESLGEKPGRAEVLSGWLFHDR